MYDSISLRLNTQEACQALPALSNVREEPDKWHKGHTRFTGRLNNLRVSIDCIGISLHGSICKYLLGNNAEQPLTRQDTGRVIESLSDTLCLPLASAMVHRVGIRFDSARRIWDDKTGMYRYDVTDEEWNNELERRQREDERWAKECKKWRKNPWLVW